MIFVMFLDFLVLMKYWFTWIPATQQWAALEANDQKAFLIT